MTRTATASTVMMVIGLVPLALWLAFVAAIGGVPRDLTWMGILLISGLFAYGAAGPDREPPWPPRARNGLRARRGATAAVACRSTGSLGCMAGCAVRIPRLVASLAQLGCCSYNNQCASPSTQSSVRALWMSAGWISKTPPSSSRAFTVEVEDLRKNYGERRIICYGLLSGRLVVIGYTPRGTTRHIFSMRKANDREKARLAPYFEIRPRQS